MAALPKTFSQNQKGHIVERKPFVNQTGYEIGKVLVRGGKAFIVTAIVRQTPLRYGIYALPAESPMDLKKIKDYQNRRESGQINIYILGSRLFDAILESA